jgi:hypothetical protein
MNAVEIADAVADLAAQPFEAAEFPFQFLAAFDKKETQLKRLRKGDTNRSDLRGGVLLQSNIHLAVCPAGETHGTLGLLKASPQTAKAKAKFILATDGQMLESEELSTGETIATEYPKLAEHIGFFLPLAGISTVREIKDNPIDVRATGRLNKLYVELLRQNPEWGTDARRHDMNHFMARLIFCFFAEDTDIFHARGRFTQTIEQFSESDGSNTHTVIAACFHAMNTKVGARVAVAIPAYADAFPYVNGGLFAGSMDVPRFTRIARSYLLQAGSLDWQHINPDIFGSMIQAVADEAERGALGMHYTSVPNILKVLNPLVLDELRAQLVAAGDNDRKLLNLRKRLSRIRVFDPACGSGNFLVIAYKELRRIEAEINRLRREDLKPTEIDKKNFRGIEMRDFAAEIARLALVIAEYQCDVLHRGPLAAKAEFLPLDEMNWITRGNALRLDWLQICPPEGTRVKLVVDDLFRTPLEQTEIDFGNEGGEVFICGNPPYMGATRQSNEQKTDIREVFRGRCPNVGNLDYVAGWLMKAADYMSATCEALPSRTAFVATNSICQGQSVPDFWPVLYAEDVTIVLAHTSFRWANLAKQNAGVTVVIIGLSRTHIGAKRLFISDGDGVVIREGPSISPYLTLGEFVIVQKSNISLAGLSAMEKGSQPTDGGHLLLTPEIARDAVREHDVSSLLIRPILGSDEFINGLERRCLWVERSDYEAAKTNPWLKSRFDSVVEMRRKSPKRSTQLLQGEPFRFGKIRSRGGTPVIIVPSVSSERRAWYPVGQLAAGSVVSNLALALYDAPLWNMALIASKLHLVWIATVCGKLKTDYRYSNTLGWNTFPVAPLTGQHKADLTRCAEGILLAREVHFPATIADLYDSDAMPNNLRAAHDRNDETLERIYIGRRFKNDTERLETLFAMYAKMTESAGAANTGTAGKTRGRKKKEAQV